LINVRNRVMLLATISNMARERRRLKPGKPYWQGRLSTFDLLMKVTCFVTNLNNVLK
jgi:hypothetical protein